MRHVDDKIQHYVESLLPPPSETLKRIADQLHQDKKWGINIGSVEGSILQFLVKALKVQNIVEIGTQYGYSTQWFLEALPQNAIIHSLEKDPAHHETAQKMIQDPRVQFYLGDALEILPKISSQGPFDLIFIDANKKAYPKYLDWAVAHVKSGGLIVGDNTFLFGTVLSSTPPENESPGLWEAMRLFNQKIFMNNDFTSCMIPTAEGLTVALKK